jgi:hypothetical protein
MNRMHVADVDGVRIESKRGADGSLVKSFFELGTCRFCGKRVMRENVVRGGRGTQWVPHQETESMQVIELVAKRSA